MHDEISSPADDAEPVRGPFKGASFPIVGIGASAGGLEAVTKLLQALPLDTGMAFVLVQHLSPKHDSALAAILSRATRMPVTEVHDEPAVEPNHVYVIPPNRCMGIASGVLQLAPREKAGNLRVVDRFFRALAEDRRHQAIGVVLSGTGNDGTLGLQAIKAAGGITFAQDDTALRRHTAQRRRLGLRRPRSATDQIARAGAHRAPPVCGAGAHRGRTRQRAETRPRAATVASRHRR
jgi:two-component system CheB/CheR fusion protein